jgi:hypothetical protein
MAMASNSFDTWFVGTIIYDFSVMFVVIIFFWDDDGDV